MKTFTRSLVVFLVVGLCGGVLQSVLSQEDTPFEKVPMRYPLPWQFPEKLEVTVVDEQEQPMPDALVTMIARVSPYLGRTNFDTKYVREYRTNQEGKAIVTFDELAEKHLFAQLAIQVSHGKEFVPVMAFYRVEQSNERISVPDKIAVTLKHRVSQTCRVVDEQGNGIEGGEVTLFFRDPYNILENYNRGIKAIALEYSTKTDSNGDFSLVPILQGEIPGEIFLLKFDHPKFQPLEMPIKNGESPETITLSPLKMVTGRVLDEDRNPISGAIIVGYFHVYLNPKMASWVTTDENGIFSVPLLPQKNVTQIQILAKGKLSQAANLNAEESSEPLEITLKKGNPIRIRAVDEDGNYVPGVTVQSYYGFQYETAITVYDATPRQNFKISCDYPLLGRDWDNDFWEWVVGAKEEYFVSVMKHGENGSITYYAEQPFYRVRPQEEPYIVKMKKFENGVAMPSKSWQIIPQMKIRVLDYDTGLPCEETQVTLFLGRTPSSFGTGGWFPLVEKKYATNKRGEIGLDFSNIHPAMVDHFSLTFQKDGYYAKLLEWSSQVLKKPDSWPATAAAVPRHLEERYGPAVPELLEIVIVPKEQESP